METRLWPYCKRQFNGKATFGSHMWMRVPFWRGRSVIRRLQPLCRGRWLSIRPNPTRTINWGMYTRQWAEQQTHRGNSPKFANCTKSPSMKIWRTRCRAHRLRWIPHKKNHLADAQVVRDPIILSLYLYFLSFLYLPRTCSGPRKCTIHRIENNSIGPHSGTFGISLVTVRAVAGERIPDARGRAGATEQEGKKT